VGDYVQTADGLHGEVQNVNVLRQLVKVLVEVGDEKELKEYEADTLQFKRRRGKKGGQELSTVLAASVTTIIVPAVLISAAIVTSGSMTFSGTVIRSYRIRRNFVSAWMQCF